MANDIPSLGVTNLLIGIDDTGGPGGGGTAALARRILEAFDEQRMGGPQSATVHQLIADPRITAAGGNASACLALKASHRKELEEFVNFVVPLLEAGAAPGSNPGLALAREPAWKDPEAAGRLIAFGQSAKTEVLGADAAAALASEVGVHLSGHGGTNAGVVGALAAIGLRMSGSDGRIAWMDGLDELRGAMTYRQLKFLLPIDGAVDAAGNEPNDEDMVQPGDSVQPLLVRGSVILLLDPSTTSVQAAGFGARPKSVTTWRVASAEAVSRHLGASAS